MRDSDGWDRLFHLLADFNQQWAENAGALVVILSRRTFEHNGESARTHSFDTGAAWQNLALQGSSAGLVVHPMEGFDYDKAREVLELEERETPSGRKPLDEIVRRI